MWRRHQLLTKRQRNPCVLSDSATSRVRVACAAIAFPRIVPVCAKAPTTVLAQHHDLLMATCSRLSILSKAWSVHSSEPAHDNEHSCARQLISAVPRRQRDATRHREAGKTHVHTEMYTDQQKDSDTDTVREISITMMTSHSRPGCQPAKRFLSNHIHHYNTSCQNCWH